MGKAKIAAERNTVPRDEPKKDAYRRLKNINELIFEIPKFTYKKVHFEKKEKQYFLLDSIVKFLKFINIEEYEKLEFDPAVDDIETLFTRTFSILLKMGFKIDAAEDYYGTSVYKVHFVYEIDLMPDFFILEACHLKFMPKALKIGYAHFLEKYTEIALENSILSHNFSDFEYDSHCPWGGWSEVDRDEQYFNEEQENPEDDLGYPSVKEMDEENAYDLTVLLNHKRYIKKYSKMPYSVFEKYKTRSRLETNIKKAILEYMNFQGQEDIFMAHETSDNDEYSFKKLFFLFWDRDFGPEEKHISMYDDMLQNGISAPMGTYSFNGETFENNLEEENISNIKKTLSILSNINKALIENFQKKEHDRISRIGK